MNDAAAGQSGSNETIRNAVVIVHGMGEQRPLDQLKEFIRTALTPRRTGWDYYYSRPAEVTKSYEARRFIARQLGGDPPKQCQTEVFEYHWSYKMTGNRIGDIVPTTVRLLLQRPRHVVQPLYGVWRLIWFVLVWAALLAVLLVVVRHQLPQCFLKFVASAYVVVPLGLLWGAARTFVTSHFVDVVRYLDTSPRSYEVRRDIRGGFVDLLRALHGENRYARIIVVAHSLGAYIAYDGLSSLWAELHELHGGEPGDNDGSPKLLRGLNDLEKAAGNLLHHHAKHDGSDVRGADTPREKLLREYQDKQFALWQGLRQQGNPWRVTDFLSVGTPMYLADLLCTHPKWWSGLTSSHRTVARQRFDEMVAGGELVQCPPRSESVPVEDTHSNPPVPDYALNSQKRQLLGSQSMFAVMRWTNLWFPVEPRGSMRGDWFGGPLGELFGPGIRDIAVRGNKPGRLALWAKPHTRYFSYPEDNRPNGIAYLIRETENLGLYVELGKLAGVDKPDPRTGGSRLNRPSSSGGNDGTEADIARPETLEPVDPE